jgi:hypothetical protein
VINGIHHFRNAVALRFGIARLGWAQFQKPSNSIARGSFGIEQCSPNRLSPSCSTLNR